MSSTATDRRRLLPLVGVLIGGVILGSSYVAFVSHRDEPAAVPTLRNGLPPEEVATRTEIETLRVALEGEVAARRRLEDQIGELREQLAARGPGAAPEAAASGEPRPAEPDEKKDESPPSFDESELIAAGMDAADVQRLRDRWEQLELAKLQLNDQALREGWFLTPRHRDAHQALAATFRQDAGETGYDAYLYATGQPNRVLVAEVLADSPASDAGFRAGDFIVSYDGRRTYNTSEVQLATGSGTRGESVRVEVLRDGHLVTIDAERGPLGVILRPARRSPESQ